MTLKLFDGGKNICDIPLFILLLPVTCIYWMWGGYENRSPNSGIGHSSAGQQLIVCEACVLSVKAPSKLNIALSFGLTHEIKKKNHTSVISVQKQTTEAEGEEN